MLHHFATWTDAGPCVAYHSHTIGGPVVVCECITEAAAASMAARLNAESAAQSHLEAIKARARHAHYGQRRGVRYFEPDTFA